MYYCGQCSNFWFICCTALIFFFCSLNSTCNSAFVGDVFNFFRRPGWYLNSLWDLLWSWVGDILFFSFSFMKVGWKIKNKRHSTYQVWLALNLKTGNLRYGNVWCTRKCWTKAFTFSGNYPFFVLVNGNLLNKNWKSFPPPVTTIYRRQE